MAARLAARRDQVQSDTEGLREAGANALEWPESLVDGNDLVTLKAMRWAASTLLSRAFQLQIPLEEPPGVHCASGYMAANTLSSALPSSQ